MNAKLKEIFQRAESWPEAAQADAVEWLLAIERELTSPYQLSSEDRVAIDRSIEDMEAGRFASEEEITAVFNRDRK